MQQQERIYLSVEFYPTRRWGIEIVKAFSDPLSENDHKFHYNVANRETRISVPDRSWRSPHGGFFAQFLKMLDLTPE
jgi:hypothetical protein